MTWEYILTTSQKSYVASCDLKPCEGGKQEENCREPHTLCDTIKSPDQASPGAIAPLDLSAQQADKVPISFIFFSLA